MFRLYFSSFLFLFLFSFSSISIAEEFDKEQKWGALKSSNVNVRTGPGKRYPVKWVYKRYNLPMKKIAEYDNWIKVEDYEGVAGWIHPSMINSKATFIITENEACLKKRLNSDSGCIAKLEKGVVGDIIECFEAKCKVSIDNWSGYLSADSIWGFKKKTK